MEETKPYTSSTEQIDLPSLRPRNVPDVPEDVDFLMEHLNDPNFDYNKNRPSSIASSADMSKKKRFSQNDDVESRFESDRYSTSRAESRNSTAIDFDERVLFVSLLRPC